MSSASLVPLIFHRDRAIDPSNNWHMKYPVFDLQNNFSKKQLLKCLPYLSSKEFLVGSSWNSPSKPCKRGGLNFCKCVQVISLFVCFSKNEDKNTNVKIPRWPTNRVWVGKKWSYSTDFSILKWACICLFYCDKITEHFNDMNVLFFR